MKLIIVGTDHELQDSSNDLKDLVASLVKHEGLTLIGEEHLASSISVAHEVAKSNGVRWIQVDMDWTHRSIAGIDQKLGNRMQIRYEADGSVSQRIRYAPEEDGIREDFWLDRIATEKTNGTALLICGAVHARKVVGRAQSRGYDTTLLFHPEYPGSQFWVSIMPELF